MKKSMALILVLLFIITVFMIPTALAGGMSGTLTEHEIEHLLFIREEEKLAYDVYYTLYQKWGLEIFAKIMESEQTHTDAVKKLIVKYGLDDPYIDEIGSFVDEDIAELYEIFTEWGVESIEDAILVGGYIEEFDIVDLREAINETDDIDVVKVYTSLLEGSYNHLNAFVYEYEKVTGDEYTKQYFEDESDLDFVLDFDVKGEHNRKN